MSAASQEPPELLPPMLLCLICGMESEKAAELTCCPHCGDRGVPADLSVRPAFKITWHELRILVMWAEFFANNHADLHDGRMPQVVYGIADRLHLQHIDGPPLTFAQELTELRSHPLVGLVEQDVMPEPLPPTES